MSKLDKSVTEQIDDVIKDVADRAQDHLASASESLTDLAQSGADGIVDLAQSGADSLAHAFGEHRRHRGALILGLVATALVLGLAFKAWSSRTTD